MFQRAPRPSGDTPARPEGRDGRVDPPPIRRIAVFRALNLGDMLCAVPALRALRAAFPAAKIALIGLPWAREFFNHYRFYLDTFREFPGYPGLPERTPDLPEIPAFLDEMRRERFDLLIQMHGSGRVTNPLTALFGARIRAGFCEAGGECPDPRTFLPYPDRGLELRRLLRLMEHLGVAPCRESLEFRVSADDRIRASALARIYGLEPRGYVLVHPGASVAERRWPARRFAEVADALAARGLAVALTGTPGEAGLTAEVARSMRAPSVDLAGKTALGPLAALLADARMLICNDTGVSHLADALGVPSVVISTGDNPERWAPADRILHRVLCDDAGVSPAEVIAEAEDLLDVRTHPDRPVALAGGEP